MVTPHRAIMLVGSIWYAQAVVAQTTPGATPPEIATAAGPDIVVTARRVEERLQDVPIAITVFNQQQLLNRNVVNAADLATYTPSLSSNTNFGSQNSTFAIRGFVQDLGTPPSVGVYFADVVAPRGAAQGTSAGDGAGPGSFFDLQNVQVLKGPQGTLFGRNTTGGAVLLVPQKPTSRLEGYVEGSLGNYGMRRIQAVANAPLGNAARFRIGVDHQTRDGYLRNLSGVGPDRFEDIDYTAVRASLVADLAPSLENYTIVSYLRSDTAGSIQKVIACNPTQSAANFIGLLACAQLAQERSTGAGFYTVQNSGIPNPVQRLDQWQVINTTTWRVSDALTIKNIASYAELRNFDRSSLYGTNFKLGSTTLPFLAISPIAGAYTTNESTATEELQAQGSGLNGTLTYQAGGYLEVSAPLGLNGNRNPQFITCTDIANLRCTPLLPGISAVNYTGGRTHYRDIGVYAQASYALTEKLKFTGGIRYTSDRITNTSTRTTSVFTATDTSTTVCTDAAATASGCTTSLRQKSTAPTWLVDADYKPIDALLLYAKYARGYRSGGVFPNAPAGYRTFSPEKVDAYEIGAKTTLRGAVRGSINVAGFYNDFSDQQLAVSFTPAPGRPVSPTTAVINAGQSRIYGAEIEASITPVTGVTLDGGYTYLHARIRSIAPLMSSDPNYVINTSVAAGDPIALSPKNKYTLTGTYTLPLAAAIGTISIGATFTHTDKVLTTYTYSNAAIRAAFGGNLGIVPSYNLLNLNLAWKSLAGLPVDLSVFATNVTARHYYTYVPGLAQVGLETAVIGEPRIIGARLRYRFGG